VRSLHEATCNVAEGTLLARWGLMQKRTTHDPEMLPLVDEDSWMLDLDVFKEFENGSEHFKTEDIAACVYKAATRVYAVFRWAVTPEFLRTYGGIA
jgi:uncharacterized protein (TIGR04255 family)